MSCDEYFSVFALEHSSYEYEVAVTNLCIPNAAKFTIFLFWLVFFFLVFLLSLSFLVHELRKSFKWSFKKDCFLFLTISCACEIITFSIHMSGSHNRGRYIVIPLSTIALFKTMLIVTEAWFQVFASFHPKIQEIISKMKWTVKIVSISSFLVHFGIYGIALVTVAEDPFVLNWVYSFANTFAGLYATILISLLVLFGRLLISCCSESLGFEQGGEEIKILVHKVSKFISLMWILIPSVFPLIIFPIWVGLTQTKTNPGLEYSLYFQYIPLPLMRAYAVCLLLWLVKKRSSFLGMTSSDKPTSSNNKQRSSFNDVKLEGSKSLDIEVIHEATFPRFTIEELNGQSREEEN